MATSETPIKLESRVAILEEKVIQLQRKPEAVAPEAKTLVAVRGRGLCE